MTTAQQSPRETPRRRPAAPQPGAPQPGARLRGLPTIPRRLSAVPFGIFIVVVLGLGTVGLLLFNTILQNQSFQVRQAQREAAELGYRVSDLESKLYAAEAPRELARRATELGMASNPYGAFIDLETGTVVGEARPVRGDEIPSIKILPPPPPEPETPLDAAPTDGQPADGQPTDGQPAEGQPAVEPSADVEGHGASADAGGGAVDQTGGDQTATGEAQP